MNVAIRVYMQAAELAWICLIMFTLGTLAGILLGRFSKR